MISSRVVSKLGLMPVNRVLFHGLGGQSWRDAYLFHVAFYMTTGAVSRIQICTKVINGGEILDNPSFDVLLGMDVITTGDLSINKDGSFRFEW